MTQEPSSTQGQNRRGRPRKLSPRRLRRVLEETRGSIAAAARRLRCSRQTIYNMLAFHPELVELVNSFRDELLDEAEAGLMEALKERQPWAICFTLRYLGWGRGYGRREDQLPETVKVEIDVSHLPDEVLRAIQYVANQEKEGGNGRYPPQNLQNLLR